MAFCLTTSSSSPEAVEEAATVGVGRDRALNDGRENRSIYNSQMNSISGMLKLIRWNANEATYSSVWLQFLMMCFLWPNLLLLIRLVSIDSSTYFFDLKYSHLFHSSHVSISTLFATPPPP